MNCPSIPHGYTGMQVFNGRTSNITNVYGFKSKSKFPKIYRDFIREEGAPSILRRDNAKAEQSEEVLQIQRELYIKDAFSEPYNQQQNFVESRSVRWLKPAINALLDKQNAPETAWYLAAQYLTQLHALIYDPRLGMTPYQKRHGKVPDISPYLYYEFWEPIYYHVYEDEKINTFPNSRERSGYWVGVCKNVGDYLTYWIVDDQSKQLLARSVGCPIKGGLNYQPQWDPDFAQAPFKGTAQHGGDIKPEGTNLSTMLDSEIMDRYDLMEENPKPHPLCVTEGTPSFDSSTKPTKSQTKEPVPIIKNGTPIPEMDVSEMYYPVDNSYVHNYKSKLRMSRHKIEIDDSIPTFPIKGRKNYKRTSNKNDFQPPKQATPNTVENQLPPAEQPPKDLESFSPKQTQKPRHSKRIATKWIPNTMRKAFKTSTLAVGMLLLPTHIIAEPSSGLIDNSVALESVLTYIVKHISH